jgi:Bacteriophage CI repressor helix-turn-helix domain
VPKSARSFTEALSRFPSTSLLAAAISVPRSTCASWVSRDSIPPEYFTVVAAAAEQLSVQVTAKDLWRIYDARSRGKLQREGD